MGMHDRSDVASRAVDLGVDLHLAVQPMPPRDLPAVGIHLGEVVGRDLLEPQAARLHEEAAVRVPRARVSVNKVRLAGDEQNAVRPRERAGDVPVHARAV